MTDLDLQIAEVLAQLDETENALSEALAILADLVRLSDEQDKSGCDADAHDAAIEQARNMLEWWNELSGESE